jgi:hypothetical protein
LRATITTLLASAGYGSVMVPLINVYRAAKEQFKDTPIKIVEY